MYFSVKKGVKIGGKTFIPCVCYPLNSMLEANVRKMEAEGTARVHEEYVFFQNGKILEKKEETATKVVKRSRKKITKEEAYEEDLVVDEDIADTF